MLLKVFLLRKPLDLIFLYLFYISKRVIVFFGGFFGYMVAIFYNQIEDRVLVFLLSKFSNFLVVKNSNKIPGRTLNFL